MTPRQWEYIRAEHEHRCAFMCGRPSVTYELIDPALPPTADNVVPCCVTCSKAKAGRSFLTWVRDHASACV